MLPSHYGTNVLNSIQNVDNTGLTVPAEQASIFWVLTQLVHVSMSFRNSNNNKISRCWHWQGLGVMCCLSWSCRMDTMATPFTCDCYVLTPGSTHYTTTSGHDNYVSPESVTAVTKCLTWKWHSHDNCVSPESVIAVSNMSHLKVT